jgi:sugar transferase EpsL
MIKRLFDFVLAFFALIALSPLMIILYFLVIFNLGFPALFKHVRPGMNETPFSMLKFRSMTYLKNEKGELLSDEKRLNSFGRWLRATSLDELPELFNVLRGDMSLVGPRPLLMEYLPRYTERQRLRHKVKPGITGWAQVNGRNTISWEEKFEHDIWYVENQSLILDIKIIFLTFFVVFSKKGILTKDEKIMPKFKKNSKI